MKAPENVIEFKKMLHEMCHRERFVFDLKNNLGRLEVYATWTAQGYGKKYILLQIVDEDGTGNPTNKLLDNWSKEYYLKIFNLLA